MLHNKTILVTGCAGFIGSHLSERLLKERHQVVGIDNFDPFYPKDLKLANLDRLRQFEGFAFHEMDIAESRAWQDIQGDNIHLVIHLAAKAGVLPSLNDPTGYIRTNIIGTQSLLDWMKSHSITKLVFGSSSSVYGNTKETPFREEMDVSKPISPYAFTKVSGEILIQTFHELYQIDAAILRFFTVIGERQRPDLAVNKFVRMIRNGEAVTMYGDGTTARDYTYVGDIVNGIILASEWISENDSKCEVFNIGNHTPIALKTMIETVYRVMETESNIVQLPMQKGDVDITYADIQKAREVLGYSPTVSFEDGVRRFVRSIPE